VEAGAEWQLSIMQPVVAVPEVHITALFIQLLPQLLIMLLWVPVGQEV
jgi:hypothetical protein